MYFEPEPKERREDLFDFESQYEELKNSVIENRITVIKGIRRTGKTSLMKVVRNEIRQPSIIIDGRIIEPKQSVLSRTIFKEIILAITREFADIKLKKTMERISASLFGLSITFKFDDTISQTFQEIDKILDEKNKKLVIFIDEAQKLTPANLAGLMAYIFDNTKNINFVLAGSEVGLLDEFIGGDVKNDLYGRPKHIIETKRLSYEEARLFLQAGFKQIKRKISEEEIKTVIEKLDGIIGWLTLYGYYSMKNEKDPVNKVLEDAAKITASEIDNFLSNRQSARKIYLRLLEGLKSGLRWVEVKRLLEASIGKKINDRFVTKYLDELKKYGLITQQNEIYILADPLTEEGVRLLTT